MRCRPSPAFYLQLALVAASGCADQPFRIDTKLIERCDPECEGPNCFDPRTELCLQRRADLCDPACDHHVEPFCMNPVGAGCLELQDAGETNDADTTDREGNPREAESHDGGPTTAVVPIPDATDDARVVPMDGEAPPVDSGPPPECRSHADCTRPEAPACLGGSCGPCTTSTQCDHQGGPVCSAGACVACTSTTGCASAAPYCDGQGMQASCVECQRDAHCTSFDAPACVQGQCSPCTTSSQCSRAPGLKVCGEGACVTCTAEEGCGGANPHCDTRITGGRCVQCLDDGDCGDPARAHCDPATLSCVPCTANGQCGAVANAPVCDLGDGRCVQCLANERQACGSGEEGVCASLDSPELGVQARTCLEGSKAGSAGGCEPCVSDHHCAPDHRCMPMEFGVSAERTTVGHFCLPIEEDACQQPYFTLLNPRREFSESPTASVDGDFVPVCTLRGNGNLATCQAHHDLSTPCTTDAQCGAEGLDDGFCVSTSATKACTVRCVGDQDCPRGLTCNPSTRLCNLE